MKGNNIVYNKNLYCNWGIVYFRDLTHPNFTPFSFKDGLAVNNVFRASHVKDCSKVRQQLQAFADRYRDTAVKLEFQLRVRGNVVFQTIPHYE